MTATTTPIEIRPMEPADHDGIIALLMLTQRWTADDLFARLLRVEAPRQPVRAIGRVGRRRR